MQVFAKRVLLSILLTVLLPGIALIVRQTLAPQGVPPPQVDLMPDDIVRLRSLSEEARVDESVLFDNLRKADVVLIGEVHFYKETMDYLTRLIEGLGPRSVSLLLELPEGSQGSIDAFLDSGEESVLDSIFADAGALPYRDILVWVRENRDRVPVVVAMDENRSRIVLNRAFLRETRNETMAEHVLQQLEANPGNVVLAYGGQLHLILAGRYRYYVENREPAGARLVRKGVRRDRFPE